jgi:hypothetical protein
MVDPPLELGAAYATLALTLPALTAPMVGAPGTEPEASAGKPAMAKNPNTDKKLFKPNICIFIKQLLKMKQEICEKIFFSTIILLRRKNANLIVTQ